MIGATLGFWVDAEILSEGCCVGNVKMLLVLSLSIFIGRWVGTSEGDVLLLLELGSLELVLPDLTLLVVS